MIYKSKINYKIHSFFKKLEIRLIKFEEIFFKKLINNNIIMN
jgi:hypothetical protein